MSDYNNNWKKNENFSSACMILGILSIIFLFIPPFLLGCIPASLSILFYCLNKSKHKRDRREKTGLVTAIIGMVLSLGILLLSGIGIYSYFTDTMFRAQVNTIMKENYGYTVDDVLKEYGLLSDDSTETDSTDSVFDPFEENDSKENSNSSSDSTFSWTDDEDTSSFWDRPSSDSPSVFDSDTQDKAKEPSFSFSQNNTGGEFL